MQPPRRAVHALDVLAGAKEANLASTPRNALRPSKMAWHVQDGGGRIERDRPIGLDPRIVPALLLLEIGQEHVIGEELAKAQLAVLGFRLERARPRHPDRLLHRVLSSLSLAVSSPS